MSCLDLLLSQEASQQFIIGGHCQVLLPGLPPTEGMLCRLIHVAQAHGKTESLALLFKYLPIQPNGKPQVYPCLDSPPCLDIFPLTAEMGNLDCLKLLYKTFIVPDSCHVDAINVAAKYGRLECLQFLLEHSSSGDLIKALVSSAFGGHKPCMDLLRNAYNVKLDSSIHKDYYVDYMTGIAEKGNEFCLKLMLDIGCDPNSSNKNTFTPLMMASLKGHHVCVKMLLSAGARPNTRDQGGWTALTRAAAEGHTKVVGHLLEGGANPDLSGIDGKTALIWASRHSHENCVKLLLKYGARMDLTDVGDRTACKAAPTGSGVRYLLCTAGGNVDPVEPISYEDFLARSIHYKQGYAKSLQEISRSVIRQQLIKNNVISNIFHTVLHLPLPKKLQSFLVYDMCLDVEMEGE